jgi:hypothetical protein
MKKLIYAVLLLFGLSIMASSCGGGTNKRSESYDNSSNGAAAYDEEDAYDYDEEDAYSEDVDPYDLYSDWSECIDLQIEEIQIGMMTGPGIVVENICAHKIKQVQIVAQSGYYSENYNFYDLEPGEVKTKPLQLPDATITDIKIEF